ncbi:MAG: diguanylate cyclase (GGDEF)-like protein [Moritella sp.]|jgi:diguanylate cyclase (GGDEF)-like protein
MDNRAIIPEVKHTIKAVSTRSIYQSGNHFIIFNAVTMLIWMVFAYHFVSGFTSELLFISLTLANIIRWCHCHYRLQQAEWWDHHEKLLHEYMLGCVVTSFTYCLSIAILLPLLAPLERSFVTIYSIMYIAGSSVACKESKKCFYILVVPSSVFIIVHLMLQSQEEFVFGMVLAIYGTVYVLISYRQLHLQQIESVTLQVSNQFLAQDLREANEKLLILSIKDELTGLANRREFDVQLASKLQQCWRAESNIALLMLDIDLFKRYNDQLGHLAGDECLRRVGTVLREACKRVDDFAARYGGEEFAIILPNTDIQGAVRIAHLVQNNLAHEAILHPDSNLSDYVTCSIGISVMVPDNQGVSNTLIDKADKALYAVKEHGRNGVYFYSAEDNANVAVR